MVCPVARPGHCCECGPPETLEEMSRRHAQERADAIRREEASRCMVLDFEGENCPACHRPKSAHRSAPRAAVPTPPAATVTFVQDPHPNKEWLKQDRKRLRESPHLKGTSADPDNGPQCSACGHYHHGMC